MVLKIPVRKRVSGEYYRFPLAACEELSVALVGAFRKHQLKYTIGTEDDSVLYATMEGEAMAVGRYALEVRGRLFGSDWRSNEFQQIQIVENNAKANTEFTETDEGENSVEMDTQVVVMGASTPAVNPMGVWDAATKYKRGDAVSYNLACWWSETENVGSAPAAGSADWCVLLDAEPIKTDIEASISDTLGTATEEAKEATAAAIAATAKAEASEERREKSEELRAAAETARVSAEEARVKAESGRVTAETERAAAEASRVAAEEARSASEELRVRSEELRVAAEDARVTAETARVAAESKRESDTKAVIKDAETATAKTKEAISTLTNKAEAAISAMADKADKAISEVKSESAAAVAEAAAATEAATKATTAAESATAAAKEATVSANSATTAAKEAAEKAETATAAAAEATEKATSAAEGAEKVNATLAGNTFTVTDRKGEKKELNLETVAVEEKVTVQITSEVKTVSVEGVTISVYINHGTAATKYTTDAEGKATFSVGKGSYYEVRFPEFGDAQAISSVGYTATLSERTITATYKPYEGEAEQCAVVVQKRIEGVSSAFEGVTLTVKIGDDAATEYTTDAEGKIAFEAMAGKTVVVTAPDMKGEGWYTHTGKLVHTFKVYTGGHTEHFTFYQFRNGIFIVDADNNEYTLDAWTAAGKTADEAVLLKCVTENLLLNDAVVYVDPKALSERSFELKAWATTLNNGSSTLLPNVPCNTSYKGQERTQLIIEDCEDMGFECPAATYAVSLTKTVGGTVLTGYLPGARQWIELWANKAEVDSVLTALYGEDTKLLSTFTGGKWCADQISADHAYAFASEVSFGSKNWSYHVVPFYA